VPRGRFDGEIRVMPTADRLIGHRRQVTGQCELARRLTRYRIRLTGCNRGSAVLSARLRGLASVLLRPFDPDDEMGFAGALDVGNIALDRALADNPHYSMAMLLREALDSGAPPSLARLPMTPEEVAASFDAADSADAANSADEDPAGAVPAGEARGM
jgi:hypothetical protein